MTETQQLQRDDNGEFRDLLLGSLPKFAELTFRYTIGKRRYSALVIPADQAGCLQVMRLPASKGKAALLILEALSERRPRSAALVHGWRSSLRGYDGMVSATFATFGRQEMFLEAFAGHRWSGEITRFGAIEVGAMDPLLDPLHHALDTSLSL